MSPADAIEPKTPVTTESGEVIERPTGGRSVREIAEDLVARQPRVRTSDGAEGRVHDRSPVPGQVVVKTDDGESIGVSARNVAEIEEQARAPATPENLSDEELENEILAPAMEESTEQEQKAEQADDFFWQRRADPADREARAEKKVTSLPLARG